MPKVLIKGLGKVLVPDGSNMDDVARAAKSKVDEIAERFAVAQRNAALPVEQGGLGLRPDNTAMERAEAIGYDMTDPLFHGSGRGELGAINEGGLFGGVFATKRADAAHGTVTTELFAKKGKTASNYDINYSHDYDELAKAFKNATGHEIDSPEGELLYKYVAEDKDIFSAADDEILNVASATRADGTDTGELSHELQRLRGRLAKNLDYDAVEMLDEHGTSFLIPYGANVRSSKAAFDPLLKNSSDILASAAPYIAMPATAAMLATQTPEAQANIRAYEQANGPISDVGSIQAEEHPLLESAADYIDKYITTPIPLFEHPLSGTSNYLRNFGRKRPVQNRMLDAAGATLDYL